MRERDGRSRVQQFHLAPALRSWAPSAPRFASSTTATTFPRPAPAARVAAAPRPPHPLPTSAALKHRARRAGPRLSTSTIPRFATPDGRRSPPWPACCAMRAAGAARLPPRTHKPTSPCHRRHTLRAIECGPQVQRPRAVSAPGPQTQSQWLVNGCGPVTLPASLVRIPVSLRSAS